MGVQKICQTFLNSDPNPPRRLTRKYLLPHTLGKFGYTPLTNFNGTNPVGNQG